MLPPSEGTAERRPPPSGADGSGGLPPTRRPERTSDQWERLPSGGAVVTSSCSTDQSSKGKRLEREPPTLTPTAPMKTGGDHQSRFSSKIEVGIERLDDTDATLWGSFLMYTLAT